MDELTELHRHVRILEDRLEHLTTLTERMLGNQLEIYETLCEMEERQAPSVEADDRAATEKAH